MVFPLLPHYACGMNSISGHTRNLLILLALQTTAASAPATEMARWQQAAARVTITRDDWGISHVRGRTDADAVFGLMYAQGEDDFSRIRLH